MTSLCPKCAHVKTIENKRGSMFFQCRAVEPPRYPPQPVIGCPVYQPADPCKAR